MGSQQERPPQKETNITYDIKARQALEFAHKSAAITPRKLVTFTHLVEGINSQITSEEKPNLYNIYEIDEDFLELDVMRAKLSELHELLLIREDKKLQFSSLAQRAIQNAEELAALKDNKTLDVYDLFAGAVKTAHDVSAAQETLFGSRVL